MVCGQPEAVREQAERRAREGRGGVREGRVHGAAVPAARLLPDDAHAQRD